MVIADILKDVQAVEERIAGVFDAGSTDARAQAVRLLFVEQLDLSPKWERVSLAGARGVGLPSNAHRVASVEDVGVEIVYVDLSEADINTNRIRKAEADAAAKRIEAELGDDLLLVFTNRGADQFHLIRPSFDGTRVTLRRMAVERDLPRRTACQQVAKIYAEWQDRRSLSKALDAAFDVEAVTNRFFDEYRRIFKDAESCITGFGSDKSEQEAKRLFTQTLFNRLMFVYFLSRKRWLRFQEDTDYLNALWKNYPQEGDENFYRDRLYPLFFFGLNTPPGSRDLNFKGRPMESIYGQVPFLNGGLFERSDLDERTGIHVPDEAIRPVLYDLFDRFNFTVMESTPYDVEVAVDPEMLGKVFEELVNERNKSGAYYTPRLVVSFMCREALKGYLATQCPTLGADLIAAFVDEHDTSHLPVAEAAAAAIALEYVTVMDPACGSGAYLLGMMQELVDLHTSLYRAGVDPKSLHELKLRIIERNLYGADIDGFAVNIAMLRLWLSLAIDYEGATPEPLPNLDFKIVGGDSLLGPDPGPNNYGDLFRNAVREQADALAKKKEQYFTKTGSEKADAEHAIRETEKSLSQALADDKPLPQGAIDWRVSFADVFAERGGFDVAIANPPYVQLQKNGGELANRYRNAGYRTFARTGDVYQLFFERGCQALRPAGGLLAYITSNSWLKAEYGKTTRRLFAEEHTPLRLVELGKDVFESAIVDSGVLMLQTGGTAESFPGVDLDRLTEKSIPPRDDSWGWVRPEGEAPWSILSPLELSVLDKMRARGTPLKEWDIAINYGIKTGFNEAFIIDNKTKDALIAEDPRSAEIIKPVLRGRDIQRYQAHWKERWLIATFPALVLNIDDYPAVKKYLLTFGRERLEQSGKLLPNGYCSRGQRLPDGAHARKKTGHAWYEMQDTCVYHTDFTKEKLLWMDMSPRGRFAYSNEEMYCNDKGFILTGINLKYLCAILNSTLITWLIRNDALTTGMGLIQWKKFAVERIPVPQIGLDQQYSFVQTVGRILSAKDANPQADCGEEEAEIDRLVYALYGLTDKEVAAVEETR